MSTIVVDATPLDTGHRTRGLGRYVQGLLTGLQALHQRGELTLALRLLRAPEAAPAGPFPHLPYPRAVHSGAVGMHLENRLRLHRALPPDTALYHATAMEGVARGLPWVATCHDLIPILLRGPYMRGYAVPTRLFWTEYMRLLRQDAARIIAISHHTKETLIHTARVAPAKIEVVYHGLAPFWSEPLGDTQPSPRVRQAADAPFVLFVGGFDPRKNFHVLVQALAGLPADRRPHLLIAGQRNRYTRWAHAALPRLRHLGHTFLEYVSDIDLRFLYARALCLAFPSHEEGWGFPIVEAMAAGAPVICADFGSMREAAGGAAITTDINRPDALASALQRLITDPVRRAEASARGRERTRRLTWESTARQVVAAYRDAI